jgi:kynurenine formamidase
MRIIDLSKPLIDGQTIRCQIPDKLPVYEGYSCEEYRFEFRSHFGCYYETSAHLFRSGTMTCDVPVEQFFLPAVIARLEDDKTGAVEPEDLERCLGGELRPGDALLVDARGRQDAWFSRRCGTWMAEKGVALLGSNLEKYDTGFVNPTGVFVELFKAEIPIIANIEKLEEISQPRFFLLALPMAIERVCTVPCRVIALEGELEEVRWLTRNLRPDLI